VLWNNPTDPTETPEAHLDRLDELEIFLAILDEGSLAGAARRLRRSPPAITRALAQLEERLGARLLERTTRRLSPTEQGRRLAEQARSLVGGYRDAVQDAAPGQARGLLRITAPRAFGRRHVTPVVSAFLDAHPATRVELLLSDRLLNLVEEGLDLAVRIGHLADSSFVARRVGEVRRVLVASPAYLARRGAPARPQDLARHETVFSTGPGAGPVEWRFGIGADEAAVRLTPRLLVDDIDAVLVAVRAGRGIARPLSYQVMDDLAANTLVRLLPQFEPPPLPVQLVVPSARHAAAKVRAFLDHAARAFAALPAIRAWG
jgi:DNA-binding transcriptional LysR family regulator